MAKDEELEEEPGEGAAGDEGAGEPDEAHEALARAAKAAAEAAFEIAPVAGAVTGAQLEEVRARLAELGAAAAAVSRDDDLDTALAMLHGRCAAIAIAAGDQAAAARWLADALRFSRDEDQRAELEAAAGQPERFRALVHGRYLFAQGQERAARRLWKQLGKGAPARDAIARSAAAELKAPRPLDGKLPTLWSYNGFGIRFAGHRDEWANGTYATTQCVTALFIPLFPIASYRVASDGEGWIVLAREPLSAFARAMRYALVAAIALVIAGVALNSHFNDPARLARQRFDRALEAAAGSPPEAALRELDAVLAAPDLHLAGRARAQRAGAEIVRLTAGMAPRPFRREHVDHGNRLVQRYKLLPAAAQGGAAQDAVVDAIEGWVQELGEGADTAEARLALLRLGADAADARRSGPLLTRITATRLAVADAKSADWPLDALAVLVEQPHEGAMARATKIVARLVESPSSLVEAGADLDRWLAAVSQADPLRKAVLEKRELAVAGRKEAEAEDLAPAQLAAMAKQRPWDQYVQLRLARAEADAGKLDAAAARLDGLGPHGLLVREARLLLAQLSSALGKLELADALLAGMLAGRLERYLAASSALEQADQRATDRVKLALQTGDVPVHVQTKYQAATGEDARSAIINEWAQDQIAQDPAVQRAREAYLAVADVVEISLAAGMVKLRRAQVLAGAEREAMLRQAERTFLAIRTAAEGQPSFRLALGEIYARLGKTAESEAEFAAVLARNEPELSLRVAHLYRNLGSVERARQVATALHEGKHEARFGHAAAELLGLLETGRDDEAAEGWYRKANQADPSVRAALLELEGRRLLRQGKRAECAAKFAEVARMHLQGARPNHNNAAVSHGMRYQCSGDLAALADAEAAFEKAHREAPEDPIVAGNVYSTTDSNSKLRVLGKRLDMGKARLNGGDADVILGSLVDGPERDALLADLAADRGAQRAAALLPQYELLAPNNPSPYREGFDSARLRRDEAAALAVVDRARRAKKLDTSEAARYREEHASGASDAKVLELLAASIERREDALSRRPAGKTRAAVLMLAAGARLSLGVRKADRAMLARAREETLEAMKLWPALDATSFVTSSLIDEAGLAADAAAWSKLRRERSAAAALAKLAAEGSPIAAAIRASKPWGEVAGHLRADRSRPGVDDLRLARLVGDAALEARANAVLGDKLARAGLELAVLLDPGDPTTKEDLAYLDAR